MPMPSEFLRGLVHSSYYGIFRTGIIWMWNVSHGLLYLNICFLGGSTLLGDCGIFKVRVLAGISEPLECVLCLWSATPHHDQAHKVHCWGQDRLLNSRYEKRNDSIFKLILLILILKTYLLLFYVNKCLSYIYVRVLTCHGGQWRHQILWNCS